MEGKELGEWCGAVSSAEITKLRIMRGGICGQLSLQEKGFQQKCQIVYCGIWIFSYYHLHRICCYYGSHSLISWIYILCEGPHEKARPVCRQEIGLVLDPPMETSFGHQTRSQSSHVKNTIIGRILVENPDHWFSKCFPNRDIIIS